jgi:regulator of protease activity HflC (stomatin/prohibitin superfamily)
MQVREASSDPACRLSQSAPLQLDPIAKSSLSAPKRSARESAYISAGNPAANLAKRAGRRERCFAIRAMSDSRVPSWGRVVAEPHEYLVHTRGGRVVRHGQGVACFKFPSDSVAIVPTSIAKLSFRADQVTLEKTGVEVTGLAVYRIAEPLLAYRMMDRDRASLTDILRDMLVGATRRIVASLSLQECITHRKERVAAALLEEVSPVLAGHGTPTDGTDRGWGVILDTVEIQDVRVLSQEVFARLQAPFREELALKALRAKDEVAREEARIDADRRMTLERTRRTLLAEEEERVSAERRRQSESQLHEAAIARAKQEAELARELARANAEREQAAIALDAKRAAEELDVELAQKKRAGVPDLSPARLEELMLTETMPRVAEAFRGSFDRINLTTGDEGALFSFLTAGLDQVLTATKRERS